jgi:hypothetical protein
VTLVFTYRNTDTHCSISNEGQCSQKTTPFSHVSNILFELLKILLTLFPNSFEKYMRHSQLIFFIKIFPNIYVHHYHVVVYIFFLLFCNNFFLSLYQVDNGFSVKQRHLFTILFINFIILF